MTTQTVGTSAMRVLLAYGLKSIARVRIANGDTFAIEITDTAAALLPKCIYAFVVGGEIQRIGSSKAPMRTRLMAYQRDISGRWRAPEGKSSCPKSEADGWRACLASAGFGEVYARQGSIVSTPVGEFPAYLDEESILIGRHRPPLNRNTHR